MEQRLTPAFFCGSAIAALTGLLAGLTLHTAWAKHPGGPQILSSTAAAAEAPRPAVDDDAVDRRTAGVQRADLDAGHVAPDPLPVTRLAPDMFDVQPAAAADETARQDAADAVADIAPPPEARRLD